jgi:hypothetical protein
MKTAAGLVAALALALPSAAFAQDSRAREGHHHCYAFAQDQKTYYTTGVWDGTFFLHEVSNAFSQELLARYGYKDRVTCSRAEQALSTLAKVTTDFQNMAAQWRAAGAKVVDVPWTYNPSTAKLPHLCWALAQVQQDGKRSLYQYVNRTILLPGGTQAAATLAFAGHVKTLRPGAYFPVPGGCSLLPADPEGQQRQVDGTLTMYLTQKPEVIRLEWTYTP